MIDARMFRACARALRAGVRVLLGLALVLMAGAVTADEVQDRESTLRVANRDIMVFRGTAFGSTPQDRARRASERVDALDNRHSLDPVQIEAFNYEGTQGYAVMINGETLFALFSGDRQPGDPPLDKVAATAGARLHAALVVRWEQGSPRRLAIGVAWTLLATLLATAVLAILHRIAQSVARHTLKLRERASSRPLLDVRRILVSVASHLVHWVKLALMLLVAYAWLAFVLSRFPYTQPWGQTLGSSMVGLVARLLTSVLHTLPDLATVLAIGIAAHLTVRGLYAMFEAARASGVTAAALQADTISATRRLTWLFVWMFAAVVAYPFLPGSSSDAFKGISVLFGVLVTLGSSGLVSQVMAGFVLIYSRALRPGDFVKIGDVEGYVLDLGVLSTKVRSRQDQEITLPNSVVVATRIINFSDTASEAGISFATSVTIGYDAPWRQVHAMLLMAAARTADLLDTPSPIVRQIALQDFYVEYELDAYMRTGAPKYDVLSALHCNIQDVFNEHGVQIMSPHFALQPAAAVVVPKKDWHTPPAAT